MLFRIYNKFDLLLLLYVKFSLKMEDEMLVLLIVLYISLIIMAIVGICCCFGGYQAWRNKDNRVVPDRENGSVISL